MNLQSLLHKLLTQEQICLEAADLVVTPSGVTKEYLQTRGVAPEKICVIPNGVDKNIFTYLEPSSAVGLGRSSVEASLRKIGDGGVSIDKAAIGTFALPRRSIFTCD